MLTIIGGPAADVVGVVTSAGHLGSKGCYVALHVDCPTQSHLRLIGWGDCKLIFQGIVVHSQVLVSGGRFVRSAVFPVYFDWVAVGKVESLALAWPQQQHALTLLPKLHEVAMK